MRLRARRRAWRSACLAGRRVELAGGGLVGHGGGVAEREHPVHALDADEHVHRHPAAIVEREPEPCGDRVGSDAGRPHDVSVTSSARKPVALRRNVKDGIPSASAGSLRSRSRRVGARRCRTRRRRTGSRCGGCRSPARVLRASLGCAGRSPAAAGSVSTRRGDRGRRCRWAAPRAWARASRRSSRARTAATADPAWRRSPPRRLPRGTGPRPSACEERLPGRSPQPSDGRRRRASGEHRPTALDRAARARADRRPADANGRSGRPGQLLRVRGLRRARGRHPVDAARARHGRPRP
jgi:hypothetical protein